MCACPVPPAQVSYADVGSLVALISFIHDFSLLAIVPKEARPHDMPKEGPGGLGEMADALGVVFDVITRWG